MPVVTGMELSEQDLAGFRELFDLVDKDGSGAIDAEEGRASLRNPMQTGRPNRDDMRALKCARPRLPFPRVATVSSPSRLGGASTPRRASRFSMPSPSHPAPDDPPQSSFAEILPCADPNDAGTEWRATRLRDLAWRARCLGVHDAPEIQSALLAMREATAELDAMSIAQSSPSYHRPWWADGEYDEARAEVANDLGVASFRARDWSAAFDHHTEAIRLEPRRAVYHANRAAAALKLGRHRCALDDADAAVERDPTHVQALSRAGRRRRRPPKTRRRAPPIRSRPRAKTQPSRRTPRPRSRPRESIGNAPETRRRSRGGAARRKTAAPRTRRLAVARPRRRRRAGRRSRLRRQPEGRTSRRRRRRGGHLMRTHRTRPGGVRDGDEDERVRSSRRRRMHARAEAQRGGRVWTASRARARLCARSRTGAPARDPCLAR